MRNHKNEASAFRLRDSIYPLLAITNLKINANGKVLVRAQVFWNENKKTCGRALALPQVFYYVI